MLELSGGFGGVEQGDSAGDAPSPAAGLPSGRRDRHRQRQSALQVALGLHTQANADFGRSPQALAAAASQQQPQQSVAARKIELLRQLKEMDEHIV